MSSVTCHLSPVTNANIHSHTPSPMLTAPLWTLHTWLVYQNRAKESPKKNQTLKPDTCCLLPVNCPLSPMPTSTATDPMLTHPLCTVGWFAKTEPKNPAKDIKPKKLENLTKKADLLKANSFAQLNFQTDNFEKRNGPEIPKTRTYFKNLSNFAEIIKKKCLFYLFCVQKLKNMRRFSKNSRSRAT